MGKEVMNKVDQYIQQMADSLGVAVDYLMEVLVQQQIIEGTISAGLFLIFTIAMIIGTVVYFKKSDSFNSWLFRNDLEVFIVFLLLMVGLFYVIVSVVFFSSGLGKLMNPEYYALKEILETIKGN